MSSLPLVVTFGGRALVPLADNEKVSIWEPNREGQLFVEGASLRLVGKWKVSMLGNFLGSGLLGYLLIRPLFMKDRTEVVPLDHLDRVVIHEKKNRQTFHLFQSRDEGMVEVHVLTSRDPQALSAALMGVVPGDRIAHQMA